MGVPVANQPKTSEAGESTSDLATESGKMMQLSKKFFIKDEVVIKEAVGKAASNSTSPPPTDEDGWTSVVGYFHSDDLLTMIHIKTETVEQTVLAKKYLGVMTPIHLGPRPLFVFEEPGDATIPLEELAVRLFTAEKAYADEIGCHSCTVVLHTKSAYCSYRSRRKGTTTRHWELTVKTLNEMGITVHLA